MSDLQPGLERGSKADTRRGNYIEKALEFVPGAFQVGAVVGFAEEGFAGDGRQLRRLEPHALLHQFAVEDVELGHLAAYHPGHGHSFPCSVKSAMNFSFSYGMCSST